MGKIPIRPLELLPESGIAIVPLTRECFAIIDIGDTPKVGKYNWMAQKCNNEIYAARSIRTEDGRKKILYLHKFLKPGEGPEIDHKNGIKLDCRQENLRAASRIQNTANTKPRGGTSRFKGVHKHSVNDSWVAQIRINGKTKHLGSWKIEEEAALAYNKIATEQHGEFAKLNQL